MVLNEKEEDCFQFVETHLTFWSEAFVMGKGSPMCRDGYG
jgi:hypothetical protein